MANGSMTFEQEVRFEIHDIKSNMTTLAKEQIRVAESNKEVNDTVMMLLTGGTTPANGLITKTDRLQQTVDRLVTSNEALGTKMWWLLTAIIGEAIYLGGQMLLSHLSR